MFPSRTVTRHLIRGALGLGFLAIALRYSSSLGLWTWAPVGLALVFLGGCPMCWTVGLVQTVLQRRAATCADGSCGNKAGTEVNATR